MMAASWLLTAMGIIRTCLAVRVRLDSSAVKLRKGWWWRAVVGLNWRGVRRWAATTSENGMLSVEISAVQCSTLVCVY